jgi:hypothetical protein
MGIGRRKGCKNLLVQGQRIGWRRLRLEERAEDFRPSLLEFDIPLEPEL